MEDNVRAELDVLKGMLENWKAGYLGWSSPDGENEHVLIEFREEIQVNIYPYVRRLFETNHLSESEAKDFMVYCYGQIDELRNQLKGMETKRNNKEV